MVGLDPNERVPGGGSSALRTLNLLGLAHLVLVNIQLLPRIRARQTINTSNSFVSCDRQMHQQGLLDMAFDPMLGVSGYPNYFYLSYTCQLNDGVSSWRKGGACIIRGT